MEDDEEEHLSLELYEGEPTEEQVVEFGKIIGMHPVRDKELMGFARESKPRFTARVPRLRGPRVGAGGRLQRQYTLGQRNGE
jgi:hypothetical protein